MGYYKWADKQLEDLIAKNPTYQRSAFPGMKLGLANQIAMSRVPGAERYKRNLFTSQGNTLNAITNNATDASQALALASQTQGQTDKAIGDLELMEADWKKFGLSNLNDAYAAMADEDRMVEQGKQLNYQNLVSLKGAQAANKFAKRKALWNTIGGISNLGVNAFSAGIFGGKGGGSGSGVFKNNGGGFSVRGNVI